MKNSTKEQLQSNSSQPETNNRQHRKTTYFSNTFTPGMTENLVAPPARVWEKIEKILDKQDDRRNSADELIASSFRQNKSFAKRRTLLLASAAGLGVVAGLMVIIL